MEKKFSDLLNETPQLIFGADNDNPAFLNMPAFDYGKGPLQNLKYLFFDVAEGDIENEYLHIGDMVVFDPSCNEIEDGFYYLVYDMLNLNRFMACAKGDRLIKMTLSKDSEEDITDIIDSKDIKISGRVLEIRRRFF